MLVPPFCPSSSVQLLSRIITKLKHQLESITIFIKHMCFKCYFTEGGGRCSAWVANILDQKESVKFFVSKHLLEKCLSELFQRTLVCSLACHYLHQISIFNRHASMLICIFTPLFLQPKSNKCINDK